jgi:uncharacterized protein (DUF58 family)
VVVTGRLAALALVATVVVTVAVPSWSGVGAATGLLVVLAAIDVLAVRGTDLEVRRPALTVIRLGRTAAAELTLHNRGSRIVRATVWDNWPASAGATDTVHRIGLSPGASTRLTTMLTPRLRGDRVAGPVTVRLIGPLGMAGRQFAADAPARVRGLPAFTHERLLTALTTVLREEGGRTTATVRGAGTEFDSVREYTPGDDVRAIDWRATARAADVMVRTWRPERHRHVELVLDTGRASAGRVGVQTRLDIAIDAALLVGGLAAATGDTVGLLAYDDAVRASLGPASGRRVQPALMHATAGLTARLVDTDPAELARQTLRRLPRRGLVVWFTDLDMPRVDTVRAVLATLARRHQVVVVSVVDPELDAAGRGEDAYLAAAAEAGLAERLLAADLARRAGVRVVAAPPHRLGAEIAVTYLRLSGRPEPALIRAGVR